MRMLQRAESFLERGWNVLLVDLPDHGGSGGLAKWSAEETTTHLIAGMNEFQRANPNLCENGVWYYGHSMGSTHTWLVGPWEPRLRALVGNCCLPTYGGIHRTSLLHCFPNFIPGIHEYGDTREDIKAVLDGELAPADESAYARATV